MQTGFEPIVDTYLPQAQRWLEAERDKPIECLLVWYMAKKGEKGRGWDELPKIYRTQFDKRHASCQQISEGEFLSIAYRGSMTGWRDLFGNFDSVCRNFIRLEPNEYLQKLSPLERWTVVVFHFLNSGVLGESFDGRRMNLAEFKMQVNGLPGEFRFPVDNVFSGDFAEFGNELKESADKYGFFVKITDLRVASVALLRFLQQKIEDKEGNTDGEPRPAYGTVQPSTTPIANMRSDLSFPELLNEILVAIDDGVPFLEIYPLLRQVEAARVAKFGESPWPGCSMVLDDSGFLLRTMHPHLDDVREARWDAAVALSDEDDKELREHVQRAIRAWQRELASRVSAPTQTEVKPYDAGRTAIINSGKSAIEPYKWPKEYDNDKWIYENIHSQTFLDLSVNHKIEGESKGWKSGLSRNQYKTRADRFADFHGWEHRRFNTGI